MYPNGMMMQQPMIYPIGHPMYVAPGMGMMQPGMGMMQPGMIMQPGMGMMQPGMAMGMGGMMQPGMGMMQPGMVMQQPMMYPMGHPLYVAPMMCDPFLAQEMAIVRAEENMIIGQEMMIGQEIMMENAMMGPRW